MRLEKILKIIKKYHWWEESGPGVFQFIMYPMHCFVEQSRYFHPKYCSVGIFIEKEDFFYEETSIEEKYEIYKYIFKQIKKDRQYLSKKRRQGDKHKRFIKIGKNFERSRAKMDNLSFWRSYEDFMLKEYIDYIRYAVMPECVDVFTDYYLEDLVQKELKSQPSTSVRKVMRVMSMPAVLSFMERERILFLELCLAMYNSLKKLRKLSFSGMKSENLFTALEKLNRSFFYLQNSFANVKFLDSGYFFKQIKKQVSRSSKAALKKELLSLKVKVKKLKAKQRYFCKKYNFSADLKAHFYIVRFLGEWIDDRKKHMLQANYYINLYCEELAGRFNLDIWQVKYYLPEDFKNLLLKGKALDPKIARARRKISAYVIEKRGSRAVPTIFYGQQAEKILKAIRGESKYGVSEFKGQVASAPVERIIGKVQIIMDVHKERFTAGRILVATMTRPEFVPYLRRAKAVITDEGGLTCHAAIVSREIKKPCIIGTKIATRALRSGDRVEMDLERGIIRKL